MQAKTRISSTDELYEFIQTRPEFSHAMKTKARHYTDRSSGEDVFQEMLLELLKYLGKSGVIENIWGLAPKVIFRIAVKRWQKRAKEPQPFSEALYDPDLLKVKPAEQEDTPEINTAISLLSDRDRFVLRNIVYGVPQTEIAEALGVSNATVTRMKTTATENLASILKGETSLPSFDGPQPKQPTNGQVVRIHIPLKGEFAGTLDFGDGMVLPGRRYLAHVFIKGQRTPFTALLRPRLRPTVSFDSQWCWGLVVATTDDLANEPFDTMRSLHAAAVHDSPSYSDRWAELREEYIITSPWLTIEQILDSYRDFGVKVPPNPVIDI